MQLKHYLIGFLLCGLCYTSQATTDDPTDNAHFGFIENKGQIHDQSGNARDDIRFMYYDDQFKLTLRSTGFSYEIVKTDYLRPNYTESGLPIETEDDKEVEYSVQYTTNRIDVDFSKANSHVEMISEGQSPFYRNYFNQYTGSAGITLIHSFSTVTYKNIYNGIDLVFSSELQADGKVFPKYEFIVHPNGNIADIALNYKGDFQFSFVDGGDLKINTGLGYIQETQPIILFSTGRASEKANFIRHGNTISFSNVKRNANETIVIDPTLQWGTYWGGSQRDLTDEIAVDLNNNPIVTGRTRSASGVSTAGAYQTNNAGGLDIPIIKWDPDGNMLWATYYGGSKNEIGFCIAIDPFNQIWIGGHTFSTSGIATPGAMQTVFGGGAVDDFDGNLSKFSNDGFLLYGTYFGGVGQDELQNIWSDEDGNIYGNGLAEALTGIVYSPCYDCTGDTAGDIVIMKFNNAGQQVWVNYWGGLGRDRGHGITTSGNNVYACGTVESTSGISFGNPGGNAFDPIYEGGGSDMFVSRWDKTTGAPIWVSYFGGNAGERGRDIRCDRDGYVYFVAQTESGTGLTTPGAWKTTFNPMPDNSDKDAIVCKYDSNCNKIWATYFGGNKIEMPRSLRVAAEGAPVYIAGYTKSDSGVTTSDAYDKKNKKNNDAFWAKINWDGTDLQYATYYGGKKSESITEPGWYGPSMELDANSSVYLSSGTDSEDGIAFGNASRDTLFEPDQEDFFIAKFNDPCPDGFEPNGSFNQATTLYFRNSTSLTHNAPIQVKNDKDYYTFRTPSGNTNLKVSLTDMPLDYNLYVYDSTQSQIGKSINTGLTNEVVIKNGTYSGKYFALVKSINKEFVTACYTLNVETGTVPFRVSDESALGSISLFPNPADNSTSLQFDCKTSGIYFITICDLQGRVIVPLKEQLEEGNQNIILPLSSLVTGTYFVKVTGGGMNDVVKLIVQK